MLFILANPSKRAKEGRLIIGTENSIQLAKHCSARVVADETTSDVSFSRCEPVRHVGVKRI